MTHTLRTLSIAVLLLVASAVWADGPQTGTIDGRVSDAGGAPLPGVTVTLSGATGSRTVQTDEEGVFRFGLLPAGDYAVGANLEGLGSAEVSASIATGERRSLELTLKAGNTETITVAAQALQVNKYSFAASASLESSVAQDVSFVGRQYQAAIESLPGVVQTATSRTQGSIGFALNGGQQFEAAGFVDGVDTSFSRLGGSPRMFLPTTSLQEVQLESAGRGVEYGQVVGGLTNAVVKSGSNQFHGLFLYVPQNQKWRAAYDELDIPRDDEVIHSFETNLGGPIYRNRAWFFAAYAEQDTNELDKLGALADPVDVGFKSDVATLKVTLQPNDRHSISLLGIDSPSDRTAINSLSGDEFSPTRTPLENEILTATWGYAIASSLFLELKLADQRNAVSFSSLREHPIDPGANPDSPLGNNYSYMDRTTRLMHNTSSHPQGKASLDIPRDQANASITWFTGANEIKLGGDYQDLELESSADVGRRYQGLGFDPLRPGGFRTPQFVDVFVPSVPQVSTSEVRAIYAQDRLTLGQRWNLFFGLRYEDQEQRNDVGEVAVSWTELAPRAAVTYDLAGNGRLLLKSTAGRYYQIVPQDLVATEFSRLPNGTNLFDRFNWNPATQRYDVFAQRIVPAVSTAIQFVDPYYKDEVTFGTEWQASDKWVVEAQLQWWEISDLYWQTDQFNAQGLVVRDIRNWDAGYRDYRALRLEANRAFSGGWTLRSNYTLSRNEGNAFGNFASHNDDLFEALGGVETGTGATNATIVNREGRGDLDRTHNVNVLGLKNFTLGTHSLGLGGYVSFRSGQPWGIVQATTILHPVSGRSIATTTYREPRDARELEDTYGLNLTGTWSFPIRGTVAGRLGIEVVNVTNEQELISINTGTGQPLPGRIAWEPPREIRAQIGIEF
jgi:hypothetical protein